jgi:hypothetical protein
MMTTEVAVSNEETRLSVAVVVRYDPEDPNGALAALNDAYAEARRRIE